MLFITNRFPKGSIQTRVGRKFEFDLKNNAPSNSVFFCRREADGQINEVGSLNFMSELKTSPYRQLLLYIHGYSNMPEDVFKGAGEFQELCDKASAQEVLVVPVIWPCDGDFGIIKDYWDDQKSADASAPAFARALCRFIEWRESKLNEPDTAPCLKRINVLAHSMGNRVLRESLVAWDTYDLAAGVPLIFRNTFLVAADIENESIHRGEKGQLICDASRNVVVYFASDDLALRSSKAAAAASASAAASTHAHSNAPVATPVWGRAAPEVVSCAGTASHFAYKMVSCSTVSAAKSQASVRAASLYQPSNV